MKHIFHSVFIAIIVSILSMSSAFSQGKDADVEVINKDSVAALNFEVETEKQAFVDSSVLYDESPVSDSRLAYKIYLPKSWEKISEDRLENYKLSKYLLGEVARYLSPPMPENRAYFSMQALRMEAFMSIEHWFENYISVRGLYLDGVKVFSDDLVHADYTLFQDDGSYKIRAVVQRNGARVILSEYGVPLEALGENSDLQKWAMTLFRLSNSSQNFEELTEEFAYLDIAGHYFPKGWGASSGDYDSIHEIEATIARQKIIDKRKSGGEFETYLEKSKGYIDTALVSKSVYPRVGLKVDELVERHKDLKFDMNNVEIIDRGNGKKDKTVGYTPIRVYKTIDNNVKEIGYELWVSYNETKDSYFVAVMLIPEKEFNYIQWAENIASYKLLLKSFFVSDY